MTQIDGGATVWSRKTIESDIFFWKPAMWFKIWFYIVSKVNHADNKQFKRGEGFFNFEKERSTIGCSPDEYKKCLHFLKVSTMISTRRSTRGIIVKVLNYNTYQDLFNYRSTTKSTTKSTTEARDKHETSTPINNNVNNETNIILHKFNEVKKKNYKVLPETNFGYWRKTYSLEEIIQAIEKIPADDYWKDVMTPDILFRRYDKNHQEVDYIGRLLNKQESVLRGSTFRTI